MTNHRIYNFGAGPAMLPEPILKQAQAEFLNWRGLGMSVMEVGHRTESFTSFMRDTEEALRLLLKIPSQYQVLFLGGAARTQFAMIPMNLLHPGESAAYLVSGIWSSLAFEEAQLLKNAYCAYSNEELGFITVPEKQSIQLNDQTQYLYYTTNETINGVRFPYVPKIKTVPLIADMTSSLLSEPLNINDYDLIFAGAQKNIANAGLTIVIIKESLLARAPNPVIPTMLNYKVHVENQSLYATPPSFNCYLAAKMFQWLLEQGGVDALYKQNCLKAEKLYDYLDSTDFYNTKVLPQARSIMNVCFYLHHEALENDFLEQAKQQGLCALKGHRRVGGIRASLYNAMPMEGVEALIHFMKAFAKDNE